MIKKTKIKEIRKIGKIKEKYDVLIIGAGPSGIFTALQLIRNNSGLTIALVDQGLLIEQRKCPKAAAGRCVLCKPFCHITSGFSGAGAFSDGKLSLSYMVGGDFPQLIGNKTAQKLIEYADKIYLSFGADSLVEGITDTAAIGRIRQRATAAGLTLVDCPIRHMGTEKAQDLYLKIQLHLIACGVDIISSAECRDLIIENGECLGAIIKTSTAAEQKIYAGRTVVATGRKGAGWLEGICHKYGIASEAGTVDIGVRVEIRNEIMQEINAAMYESKLVGYPLPFKNKVRTFCQNPGGYVAQENYENNLALVNGHSYKNQKSDNTNVAILCSHNFLVPFNQPILYAQKIGQLLNMLAGDGRILVQRLGDIRKGKRTWQHELESDRKDNINCSGDNAYLSPIDSAVNRIQQHDSTGRKNTYNDESIFANLTDAITVQRDKLTDCGVSPSLNNKSDSHTIQSELELAKTHPSLNNKSDDYTIQSELELAKTHPSLNNKSDDYTIQSELELAKTHPSLNNKSDDYTIPSKAKYGKVRPTLIDAVAGDITSAIPYRTMTSILSFIEQADKVVPGFGSDETLLYAPEIKFYSNRIRMDDRLNTSIRRMYCLGDSSGWTRGLMMASVMGIYLANILCGKSSDQSKNTAEVNLDNE